MSKRVLIGMSGGVDSSVAVYLLQQAGYACEGGTMKLLSESDRCGSQDPLEDAKAVAVKLSIPFHGLDLSGEFRSLVMEQFVRCYESGATPNPCIQCNKHLKFGFFLKEARALGCDLIATGHYARVRQDPSTGRFLLCKAVDENKDQSYFLYCIGQDQLAHTLFPLGELSKAQVRQIAEEQGFLNAKKRDSQDICFIPDGDYLSFLKRFTGKDYPAGNYLDVEGKVVGQHQGAVGYTLGQRKGLGIAMGQPVYVCAKDMAANTVTVGPNEALYHSALRADNWNWFPFSALTEAIHVKAKTRSRMQEQPATVYPEPDGTAKVVFDEPQRAITPGQAVVLYEGDVVIGGGTITEVL